MLRISNKRYAEPATQAGIIWIFVSGDIIIRSISRRVLKNRLKSQ
jgi:hypothetical protein